MPSAEVKTPRLQRSRCIYQNLRAIVNSNLEEDLENESKKSGKQGTQDCPYNHPYPGQKSNSLEAVEWKLIERDEVGERHNDAEQGRSEKCG